MSLVLRAGGAAFLVFLAHGLVVLLVFVLLVAGAGASVEVGTGRVNASARGKPSAAAPACSKVACAGVTVMVTVICCMIKTYKLNGLQN